MTDETRCEPPPEWRGKDGWHWVQCMHGPKPDSYAPEIRWWYAPSVAANIVGWWEEADARSDMDGYRYLAPVTPPATIAALVEALEGMMNLDTRQEVINEPPEADDIRVAAQQALALYRGEAGR